MRRNSGRLAHHGSPQHRSRLPPTRCHKGVSASDVPLGRTLSQVGEAAAFGATKSGTIGATAQGRFRETEEAADKVIGGETDQRAGPRHPIDGVRANGVSSRDSDTHRGPIYFPDSGGKRVRSPSG